MYEECGAICIINSYNTKIKLFHGVLGLQHRGYSSYGMSLFNDSNSSIDIIAHGAIKDSIENSMDIINSAQNTKYGFGHTRYATTGSSSYYNIQPFKYKFKGINILLTYNGNISNYNDLRLQLINNGIAIKSDTDSEVICALIAYEINRFYDNNANQNAFDIQHHLKSEDIYTALSIVQNIMEGAYSAVIAINNMIFLFRDKYGIRPMSIGLIDDGGIAISSETCVFERINASYIRDCHSGEILDITDCNADVIRGAKLDSDTKRRHCVFEHVYFSLPKSIVNGIPVNNFRFNLGSRLAEKNPAKADVVIAVPQSSIPIAEGYAHYSGIPFEEGIVKNQISGRTFIASNATREQRARKKYKINRNIIDGKSIVVVDDSIVRGLTFKVLASMLYDNGAREIHVRIGSPVIRFSCFYGIDTPDPNELIANTKSIKDMIKFFNINSLAFIDIEDLVSVGSIGDVFCTACFDGKYLY